MEAISWYIFGKPTISVEKPNCSIGKPGISIKKRSFSMWNYVSGN